MSYTINDPFVLYSGDFMIFRAAFVELVARKVLEDNGFDHHKFAYEFTPHDSEGYDAIPEAFEFLVHVFQYMGYDIDIPEFDEFYERMNDGKGFKVKISLPELDGFSPYRINKYRKDWMTILSVNRFYGVPCKTEIKTTKDKKSTLVLTFYEDAYFEWPGIADLIFNFCELRKKIKEVLMEHGNGADTRRLGSNYPLTA